METQHLKKILSSLLEATIDAGEKILHIYEKDEPEIQYKKDNSPVTEADLLVDQIVTDSLRQLTPQIPIISEEALVPYEERKDWEEYWILDPIDGTREFINKTGEFTINIGFIKNGVPQFGVLYIPITKELYYGGLLLNGSYKKLSRQAAKQVTIDPNLSLKRLCIACSKDHRSPYYAEFKKELLNFLPSDTEHTELTCGSTIKIAKVAEGQADIYVRLAGINDWDLAAGHAITLGAGGCVFDINMKSLMYNTKEQRLVPFMVLGSNIIPWYLSVPEELREKVREWQEKL